MPTGIYNRKKAKFNKGMFKKGCVKELNNGNWKGGRVKHLEYIKIHQPNHPFADKTGYIREHRLIIEKQIGRYLLPEEQTHHLGTRKNNDIHKLMLFNSFNAHMRFEKGQKVLNNEIVFDGRKLKP